MNVRGNKLAMFEKDNISALLAKYGILLAFILLFVFLSVSTETFFTATNILNVLRQISINGIIAVGMTFVIITGGIDLSVGSILALSSIVACTFAHPGEFPVAVPVLIGMLIGMLCGIFNGIIISKGRVAPFIVTLGMLTIARGLTQLFNDGRPVNNLSPVYNFIGGGFVFGIPIPIILLVAVIVVGAFLLSCTRFGRYVYAIGGNETAAKISGINTVMVKAAVYVISGFSAALAGIVLSARVESATVIAGTGYELDAIAAVVIGGTSLSGGKGTIYGTVIGMLIIGVLSNGLDIMNISSYYQQIIKGAIIITAVFMDKNSKQTA